VPVTPLSAPARSTPLGRGRIPQASQLRRAQRYGNLDPILVRKTSRQTKPLRYVLGRCVLHRGATAAATAQATADHALFGMRHCRGCRCCGPLVRTAHKAESCADYSQKE